ncbi:MAG TPA: ClpXP protease specificity-enhancing factor [Pusillimonas sp.]|jgi:stringent starvation protein B|nr:ClpXP protease specificity-enhancing factor [Pusillimonas sp.]MBC41733.1 ClpXP protease specificity-enhancing factor [Pusillimonas sp.]HBT34254.1 ClpXP protease specificity-enhancing factor [Pusillimonas sp.]HCP77753.1 ClpXP protease specificity-enhancing factor [Pusillimonas sp.]|tara:strand:- start:251030 stop:251476 length:447 start_codon:yes stop_codon:yes gene_type:complete
MPETSTKPYLIRALHEWCTDNGYTPQIVVSVDANTVVPKAHIHDGQITLNIGTLATNALVLGNEYIEFQARFSGVTEHIFVPVCAVAAIYSRETGAGMGFEVEPSAPYPGSIDETDDTAGETKATPNIDNKDDGPDDDPKRPRLTIVK